MLKTRIEQDLKTALLGGEKAKVEVLRGLKSAILYEEVAKKVREKGLSEEEIITVLAREAKKRAESADLYKKAGADDRAATELSEKAIIDEYLPTQMSDDDIIALVDDIISANPDAQMGQVIGLVKQKVGAAADGARIAAAVKSKLQ